MGAGVFRAMVLSLLVGAGGCTLLVSLDGLDDGARDDAGIDAGRDADLTADAASDGGTGTVAEAGNGCPTGRGPRMVRIDAGAVSFCIDSTEVTRTQYVAFLDSPEAKATTVGCEWNTTFTTGSWTYKPTEGNLPATGIDFCDAYSFCKWAGKRLCGAVDGGTVSFADMRDPARSQWQLACSRGGTRPYSFGQTSMPTACNSPSRDSGTLVPVGSLATCEGGYEGIFDMGANAAEWEDNCVNPEAGINSQCEIRGGSYLDDEGFSACAPSRGFGRGAGGAIVAARCCAP